MRSRETQARTTSAPIRTNSSHLKFSAVLGTRSSKSSKTTRPALPPADAHRRAAHPRRQRQGRGQEGTRRGHIPCEISKNTLHLCSFSPSSSRSGSGIARAPKRRPRRCLAGPAGRRGEDVRRADQSPDLSYQSSSSPVKIEKKQSKAGSRDQSGGGCAESRRSSGANGKDDECCDGPRGIGSASDVRRDGGGSDWGVRRRRH